MEYPFNSHYSSATLLHINLNLKRTLKEYYVYIIGMVNYQNSKIYKIWDNCFTKCYIGSTVERLSKRFARHKENYNRYKNDKYHFVSSFVLFDEFGVENCKIELVENFSCQSKEELFAREGHYIRSCECVNYRIQGRTIQEYNEDKKEYLFNRRRAYQKKNEEKLKKYNHQWYEKNKEHHKSQKEQYCLDNPEKVKQQQKISYERKKEKGRYHCECGSDVYFHKKKQHEKTQKHQQYIQSSHQNNPQE